MHRCNFYHRPNLGRLWLLPKRQLFLVRSSQHARNQLDCTFRPHVNFAFFDRGHLSHLKDRIQALMNPPNLSIGWQCSAKAAVPMCTSLRTTQPRRGWCWRNIKGVPPGKHWSSFWLANRFSTRVLWSTTTSKTIGFSWSTSNPNDQRVVC